MPVGSDSCTLNKHAVFVRRAENWHNGGYARGEWSDSDRQMRLKVTGGGAARRRSFLATTDFSIVNVALPTIDADLHASAGMLQLVVAGYGTPFALLLVIGGRLGDAFGRRRLFSIGMAAFTLASLLCGLAPSIGWLVLARAAQGAASAMMVPQV